MNGKGRIDRRGFLRAAAATGATAALSGARAFTQGHAPAIVTAPGALPVMPQGIAAGDPASVAARLDPAVALRRE